MLPYEWITVGHYHRLDNLYLTEYTASFSAYTGMFCIAHSSFASVPSDKETSDTSQLTVRKCLGKAPQTA